VIRKRYGLEAAQVILGHASADVTQVYAERDLQKAVEIMREVGRHVEATLARAYLSVE
jgi:site-specific recombinase XerC